jgi:hypothetical protein
MAGYNASRAAFTPSATQSLVLDADTAGDYGKVTKVTWGGELTASTAARTRWTRPTTNGSSTFTSLVTNQGSVSSHPSNSPRNRCGTFASAPTIAAAPEAIFGISWNKHGGGGIWSATQPDEEWVIVNGLTPGQQIACVQDVDTTATSMSTSIHWKED